MSSTRAPPDWTSFAAVCTEWWTWWSMTRTSRSPISVGIVAMCPMDVEGVTMAPRPNSRDSVSSTSR